jgi:hypothetical protein
MIWAYRLALLKQAAIVTEIFCDGKVWLTRIDICSHQNSGGGKRLTAAL